MKKVVGIRKVEYTSKKTNKEVKGQELHVTSKDRDTDGLLTSVIYMSENLIANTLPIAVGTNIRPLYNERGWLESIEIMQEK